MVLTDGKVEFANVKETMRALEEHTSASNLMMICAVEVRNNAQGKLETTSRKWQFVERAITVAFGQLKKYSINVRMADVSVQTQVKTYLKNYNHEILDQVKQSTEAIS